MFKKLLVAVLALAFIVGMFSSVLAIKNPSDIHKIIAPAPISNQKIPAVTEDIRPNYTMPTTGLPTKGNMPVGASYSRGSGPGTNLYYDVNLKYFWNVNNADMRFSTNGDKHTLNTLQFMFNSATSSPGAGITAYVWNDNGFGFPGSVIYSVNVPHASVQFYPNATTINVAAANIVLNDVDYHVGFIANNAADQYRIGSDDGTGAVDRSRVQLQGNWFNLRNTQVPNLDVNFSMTVNATVAVANAICADQIWGSGLAFIFSDKLERDVRFTATALCTLKTVSWYTSSSGRVGTGGLDVKVYSDNAGLPGTLIATQHVISSGVTLNGYTVVNMLAFNLVFGLTDFHVSVGLTNPADQYKLASDAGSPNTGRSFVYSGGWLNTIAYGTPYNWAIQTNLCCAPLAVPCFTESYNGSAAYFWRLPDTYGDYGNAMRFSNANACTLKTLQAAFYSTQTVGAPGVTFHTWSDAGGLPGAVTNSFVVNPVTAFYPTYQVVNVAPFNIVITGDYHMGVEVIQNTPTDVICTLSDNGAAGTTRSSENFGAWGSMLADWGLDVNFLMQVGKCCPVTGVPCLIACNPLDQWPTFAHDYNRSSQSGLQLGDVCGIREKWVYDGTVTTAGVNIVQIGPIIANDRVFQSFSNRLVCLNLLTGATNWDTKVGLIAPEYASLINTSMQNPVTVEGNFVYFGTGSLKGFVKASALTGDTIWTRHASTFPLPGVPGTTRVTPSVIMGNEIYFGDDNGQIYALDKTTGASLYFAQLLNAASAKVSVMSSPSTDGTKLFFGFSTGTGTTGAAGGVTAVTPGGAFTPNWTYVSPLQGTLNEGYLASPSYRCNNLFIQSSLAFVATNGFQGVRMNLNPLTGAEQWAAHNVMGRAGYAPPATTNNMVYFSNEMGVTGGDQTSNPITRRGIRAVNFANTTVWLNSDPGTDQGGNNVWNSAALTCDPWVIYATRDFLSLDGHLYFSNGNTGVKAIDYAFDGNMFGAALAKGSDGKAYVVVAQRSSGFSTANAGRLYAFCDQGPRPRLAVPTNLVSFSPTSTVETAPVQRIHTAAIKNTGCATLTYTATLVAGAPAIANRPRITSVDPELEAKADQLSARLTDVSIENMGSVRQTAAFSGGKFFRNSLASSDDAPSFASANKVKPAQANSSKLAPPSWVSWILPSVNPVSVSSSVAAAGSANWTFQFNRALMTFLGDNYYFVDVSTNDPDYIPYMNPQPAVQAEIEYHIQYVYCPRDTGRMAFGNTGGEWWTNDGEFGDGLVSFDFTLDNSTDGAYDYESSIYFMTSMNTAAWNVYGSDVPTNFGYLFPYYITGNTCGSCVYNTTLPVEYTTNSGATYANTVGDLCTFAMIDSGQAFGVWPHQAGPSLGILVKYREVGTYGTDFGAFKLVVMDIINRNASPINGLYYGMYADLDVGSGNNNGNGDVSKSVVYLEDPGTTESYGIIGLPLAGSYRADGTKTKSMYNAYIVDNTTQVYPTAACPNCQEDSLYAWVDNYPAGQINYSAAAVGPTGPAADEGYDVALGKVNLAGNGTYSFGFAQFGLASSATPTADAVTIAKFVNKYAGFARGDVNNDGQIDLRDVVYLSRYVGGLGNGPYPFKHLGDVNNDGAVDALDCAYLANYFFTGTNPPKGAFKF